MVNELQDAINKVLQKNGFQGDLIKKEFSGGRTSFNLSVYPKQEKEDFEKLAKEYGFSPKDYGKKLYEGKKHYKLIGFNPRSKKNPCILFCEEDGLTYNASPSFVKTYVKDEFEKLGLSKEDLGKEFVRKGKTYRFVGVCNRKHPCRMLCLENGKEYLFDVLETKYCLGNINKEELEKIQKENFSKKCYLYDFTPEDYGTTIILNDVSYKFIGFEQARKNNCLIERIGDEERFVVDSNTIHVCMEKARR